jgi:hypothetical protein
MDKKFFKVFMAVVLGISAVAYAGLFFTNLSALFLSYLGAGRGGPGAFSLIMAIIYFLALIAAGFFLVYSLFTKKKMVFLVSAIIHTSLFGLLFLMAIILGIVCGASERHMLVNQVVLQLTYTNAAAMLIPTLFSIVVWRKPDLLIYDAAAATEFFKKEFSFKKKDKVEDLKDTDAKSEPVDGDVIDK